MAQRQTSASTTSFRANVATLVVALLLAVTIVGRAQRPPSVQGSSNDEPVCLGFAFGSWPPALDWRAAGHGAMPDMSVLQHAAPGRDWASATSAGPGDPDSLLVLFPSWWPAGVGVELPTRTPAPGDTVTGRAVAFTADGNKRAPVSRIRAWRKSCADPGR